MSLLDALLLDPARVNVWIAHRTDGIAGSGTHTDPYDGSTRERFDTLMRVTIGENTCVHLGPGAFETEGYFDGQDEADGWRAKRGVRIVGSGIDVTTIKLVNTSATDKRFYAFGHPLTEETVDFFEVCDLTIDCNLGGVGGSGDASAAGALRILGNFCRASRLRVINWGNKNTSTPGLVVEKQRKKTDQIITVARLSPHPHAPARVTARVRPQLRPMFTALLTGSRVRYPV